MEKSRLLAEIIRALKASLEAMLAAARATHEEATHEDSKAENKYDTRGLEASYLAGAQARQAEAAALDLAMFETLPARAFGPEAKILVGALVEVDLAGARDFYFIGPGAGGMEVEVDGVPCVVVTKDSPIGQRLVGAKLGAKFALNGRTAEIVSVR